MAADRARDRIRGREGTLIRFSGAMRRPTPTGPDDTCPGCGSAHVARIVYGVVDWCADLQEALMAGDVVLGGCMVFGGDPDRACSTCRHRWRSNARQRAGAERVSAPVSRSAPNAKKSRPA